MRFCPNCNFKYYQKETEEGLKWQCKVCGTEEPCMERIIITKKYKGSKIDNINVTDIIYDPSYPRSKKYKCPTKTCESNKDKKKRECIFLTGQDMKKIYVCVVCRTQWGY